MNKLLIRFEKYFENLMKLLTIKELHIRGYVPAAAWYTDITFYINSIYGSPIRLIDIPNLYLQMQAFHSCHCQL